jgi:hypothetical protein
VSPPRGAWTTRPAPRRVPPIPDGVHAWSPSPRCRAPRPPRPPPAWGLRGRTPALDPAGAAPAPAPHRADLAGALLSPALRHAAGAPGARRPPGGAVALPTPPWAAPSPGACAGARSQAAGAPPSACRPRGGVGGAGRAALAVRPPAGDGAAVSPLPRSGPAHAHQCEPSVRAGVQKDGTPPAPLRSRWT